MPILLNFLRGSWAYILTFFSGAMAFKSDEKDEKSISVKGWIIFILFFVALVWILNKFKLLGKITGLFRGRKFRRPRFRRFRRPRFRRFRRPRFRRSRFRRFRF